MKGAKPKAENVIPMKGAARRAVPDAPDFLCDEGRDVWEQLAPLMIAKDRLEPHFEFQFAAYCEAVAAFIRASHCRAMDGDSYSVKTRNGLQQKKTAAVGLQVQAMADMNRLSALFGLTPVDERRLSSSGQGDLFKDLLKQINGGDASN